jgi:hypothetical protein
VIQWFISLILSVLALCRGIGVDLIWVSVFGLQNGIEVVKSQRGDGTAWP